MTFTKCRYINFVASLRTSLSSDNSCFYMGCDGSDAHSPPPPPSHPLSLPVVLQRPSWPHEAQAVIRTPRWTLHCCDYLAHWSILSYLSSVYSNLVCHKPCKVYTFFIRKCRESQSRDLSGWKSQHLLSGPGEIHGAPTDIGLSGQIVR